MENGTPPQFSGGPLVRANPVGVDAIAEAITVFTRRPAPWIVASIPLAVASAIYQGVSFVPGLLTGDSSNLGLRFGIVGGQMVFGVLYSWFWYAVLGGMTRMAVRALSGETVEAKDAFRMSGKEFRAIGFAALLAGIVTSIGFAACLVPGFIFYGLCMLIGPLVFVGKRPGADAFVESINLLRPYLWPAAGVHFLLGIINFFGMTFCFVGQLVTLPIYALTIAIVYLRLTGAKSASPAS